MYKYNKKSEDETKDGLRDIELVIKIDSDMHSCIVYEKGTCNSCIYAINDLSDIMNCVKEYVDEYVKK